MKTRILAAIILIVLIGVGLSVWHKNATTDSNKALTPMSLALDWTPNTNHTGIYVAMQKGWYKDAGINLKLLPYSTSVMSDTLVSSGKADVGIGFTEGVVADSGTGSPVVSIAAILAHNTSIIAVRKDSGITSPKQLEGKIFGGYGAPYEQPVMSQVIKNAGGTGNFKNITVNVDPLEALKSKQVDFVWVYQGWEGIQAKREGLQLTTFSITDFGIPDYSTPNIITSPAELKNKKDLLKKFMAATSKGYEYARQHPEESAQILINTALAGTFADPELIKESQQYLSQHYQDSGKKWGVQDKDFWHKYPEFMVTHQAVLDSSGKPVNKIDFDSLYTNELLL